MFVHRKRILFFSKGDQRILTETSIETNGYFQNHPRDDSHCMVLPQICPYRISTMQSFKSMVQHQSIAIDRLYNCMQWIIRLEQFYDLTTNFWPFCFNLRIINGKTATYRPTNYNRELYWAITHHTHCDCVVHSRPAYQLT